LIVFCHAHVAWAQPLLQPGMTVVTHLPTDTTTDYVLQVFDTRNVVAVATPGSNWSMNCLLPPLPQNAQQWKYNRMGEVFGVTIDGDANIYAASGRFLNDVIGQVGTAGAGGIYRINANDWSVSDFVVTDPNPSTSSTSMIPNTGCGLGNITYDKWHDQLFATNMEDGKIYRIGTNGTILSTFDPFTADDGTPGVTAFGDILWGIGVYQDTAGNCRVYFSNWTYSAGGPALNSPFDKNTVWSVALDAAGNFTGTEQLEISSPDYMTPWGLRNGRSISCINFSSTGTMLLAERTMFNTSSANAHESRVLTFESVAGTWTLLRSYHVGIVGYQDGLAANCAGGADFAYADSDPSDTLNGCEELIWCTADAIKRGIENPDNSPDNVYGLAGLPIAGNSVNVSATDFVYTNSYMVDLNNDITDIPKTFMGSCAVLRTCFNDDTAIVDPPNDSCDTSPCMLVNVITPNGDNRNDVLSFDCATGTGWKLEVFNRWGDRVYTSNNYLNDWNGDQLSEGVYYYILTSPCDGHRDNGFFHLLRAEQ